MSKVDWEKVVDDLKVKYSKPVENIAAFGERMAVLQELEEAITRHTVRTEEDYPQSEWWWVAYEDSNIPVMVFFNSIREIDKAFTPRGYPLDALWYRERRNDLRLISPIKPPDNELGEDENA